MQVHGNKKDSTSEIISINCGLYGWNFCNLSKSGNILFLCKVNRVSLYKKEINTATRIDELVEGKRIAK